MGSGNSPGLPGNIAEKTKTFAEKLKQTKVTSKMQVHNNYSANERYGIDSIERKGKFEYIKNGRTAVRGIMTQYRISTQSVYNFSIIAQTKF